MSGLLPQLSKHQIQRFHPLKLVEEKFHAQLIEKSVVLNFDKGDTIFAKNEPRLQSYYLLSGIVEIKASLFSRYRIEATDPAATFQLEEKTTRTMRPIAKVHAKVWGFK